MLRIAFALLFTATAAFAQGEVVRTELSRADVPGHPDMEVIVTRLEIGPKATVPRHTHPGDEHLVVITGGDMKAGNGQLVPFPDGATALFPMGVPHGGLMNVSDHTLIAITTHVVKKGEPFSSPVE